MSDWRALVRMHLHANALGQKGDYISRWIHLIFIFKDWQKQGFISKWNMVQTWEQVFYESSTANSYEWIEGEVTYV